jgi:hypothetical protein
MPNQIDVKQIQIPSGSSGGVMAINDAGDAFEITGKREYIDSFNTIEVATNKYWIDGKRVYRKTINFGALPNNTVKSVAHGLSSLDSMISIRAWWKDTTATVWGPLPTVYPDPTINYDVEVNTDATNINVKVTYNASSKNVCYVTLEYTKTTDSTGLIPNSFQVTNGTYVDAYSTTEFKTNKYNYDGRPIYRKTIDFGALPNTAAKSVAHGLTIANLNRVLIVEMGIFNGTYATLQNSSGLVTDDTSEIEVYIDGTNMVCVTGTDRSSYNGVGVIEYTKTADATGSIPTSVPGTIGGLDYAPAGTEQNMGYNWIDGKRVYRKVVNFGALPDNTTKTVAHNITGLSYVVKVVGISYSSASGKYINVPYTEPPSVAIGLWVTSTDVAILTAQALSSYASTYIMIEYTK